jgi:hypothetical protein
MNECDMMTTKEDLISSIQAKSKINIKFNINDNFFNEQHLDLFPVYKDMVEQLNELEIAVTPFQNLGTKNTKDVVINIHLTSDSESFKKFTGSDDALGCHCFDKMPYFDNTPWDVNEHSIFIDASMERFIDETKKILDINGIYDNLYKSIGINDWLETITHEISHAIEFIECSNGKTPYEVNDGHLYSNYSCSTGLNIRDGFDEILSNDKLDYNAIIDLMETRVEEKGQLLIKQLDMEDHIERLIPKIIKSKSSKKNKIKIY